MDLRQLKKIAVASSLLWATYTAYECPCTPNLECHYTEFLLAVGIPMALCIYENEIGPIGE